jgi:hypothetical protein
VWQSYLSVRSLAGSRILKNNPMQSSPLHDAGRNAESHSDQTHPLGQLTATVSYPNLGPGVSAQPAGASSQVFLLPSFAGAGYLLHPEQKVVRP